MAEARVERRLAAIFAGDIAGYSRLMGADEEGTLSRLNTHRREFLEPKIADHRGRIVKRTGDGILIEFASAVDAARCAVEIQQGMIERNASVPQDKRIEFRIGIHVGDIIIEDGDIFGDGVNIAARLEGIAQPGGICISDDAYRQVRGKLDANFQDAGEQALKNIARPVRVYQLQPAAVRRNAPRLALLDKPSIAVLPFQNMSGDPGQEDFADGMVEDIITSLSKVHRLFVIARNSTFTYKNRPVDIRQVARELGVRYVLEGSVRRAGDRLRVAAELIEAVSGTHVWAERYDRPVRDVFDVQDEITKEIVLALSIELTDGERRVFRPFDAKSRGLARGHAGVRSLGRGFSQRDLRSASAFERAASIDPKYTIAWAFIGWTYFTEVRFGFSSDPRASLAKAAELAEKCIAMSPDDPQAHGIRAGVWVIQGRFDDAVRECEIAIAGAPSDAYLWCVFGRVPDLRR